MAKRTRKGRIKDKKKIYRIEVILIVTIIFMSSISGFLLYKLPEQKKKYNNITNEYNKVLKKYNDKEKEYDKLLSDLKKYDNIDESINTIKNTYFTKIKALEDDILNGKSDRKIAYLTFDDGPYYNTYRIFDILDENDVKATFFTTNINGEYCFDNKSENCWIRYKEYINKGHTIANHTYTHAIFRGLYSSTESFMNAVVMQEELVYNQTGYTTNILRFPGGSSTAKGLKDPIIEQLRNRGYGWVDWSAQDGDGGELYSTSQAWSYIYNSVNDNIEVILMHDYNGITTEILDDLIKYLKENGYELYPLFYESNMINK